MTVLAIVSDLMFSSKIRAAASEGGAEVVVVKRAADVDSISAQSIDVIVVDLEARTFDSFDVWKKAKETFPSASSVGFYSHVNDELAAKGEEAGIGETMPRSQFVRRLGEIVKAGS